MLFPKKVFLLLFLVIWYIVIRAYEFQGWEREWGTRRWSLAMESSTPWPKWMLLGLSMAVDWIGWMWTPVYLLTGLVTVLSLHYSEVIRSVFWIALDCLCQSNKQTKESDFLSLWFCVAGISRPSSWYVLPHHWSIYSLCHSSVRPVLIIPRR